jgi:hypothetical protein
VLWRWAKPSKIFIPTENTYFNRIQYKSQEKAVRAGLNPIDWEEMMSGEGEVLHKIVLSRQQAKLCVVAEADPRPTEEEITEYNEGMDTPVGSYRRYIGKTYARTFVPLLEYTGGYNLPEVLIPFPVKAEKVRCEKLHVLFWKL